MSRVTVFYDRRTETAVTVRDGMIAAIGPAVEQSRTRSQVVDIGGGQLVPAFRDGHAHPLWAGQTLLGPPIGAAHTIDELLRCIADYAAARPGQDWLIGAGYEPTLLPGGLGDASVLDRAEARRPVLLWANDHHTAWANSAALLRAGIGPSTPDPPRGRYVRRSDGSPTGALLEEAAHAVAAHAPVPTTDAKAEGLLLALRRLTSAGIAWVLEASVAPPDIAPFRLLAERGTLPCPVDVALRVEPGRWRDQIPEITAAAADLTGLDGTNARTVKFFADGVVEFGTAALLEPYADNPQSRGIANWSADELSAAMVAFDARGFQIHVHAIGDAAVRAALDTVEHVQIENGAVDRRPVVAHVQVVHPDDRVRFARLGVIANFQPLWAQQDRVMVELTEPRLGHIRSCWQYPVGELARLGTHISFGSDWPVTSPHPLEGLATAVTRQTRDGRPPGGWLPEQRLTLEQAVQAYTRGVAYQAFDDAAVGTIAVGQRADLCLLGADLNTVPPAELSEVPVLATWVAGELAYSRL